MKSEQVAIVIFGHDKSLLETRQWVLQTRGYRALAALELAEIKAIPTTRRVELLLLCHSVTESERAAAITVAEKRWPGCRNLVLAPEQGRMPSGILGQLLHTMDGPARLISLVAAALDEPTRARAS